MMPPIIGLHQYIPISPSDWSHKQGNVTQINITDYRVLPLRPYNFAIDDKTGEVTNTKLFGDIDEKDYQILNNKIQYLCYYHKSAMLKMSTFGKYPSEYDKNLQADIEADVIALNITPLILTPTENAVVAAIGEYAQKKGVTIVSQGWHFRQSEYSKMKV